MIKFSSSRPRRPVRNPALIRPNWLSGDPRDPQKLWLDKNENVDPELSRLTSEILQSLPVKCITSYPDAAHLYRKLSTSLELGAEHLLLSAGSDGSIRAAFEAYVEPGDTVIHPNPTFAMYSVYCQIYGANEVPLDYRPSKKGPLLKTQEVIDIINTAKAKLVCLPNPDSPTGTVFLPNDLRAIIEAAGEAGSMMLIDEAYYPFYEESALLWVQEYGHLIVTRSTGKAWGIAGMRIGYSAASPEIAANLHKVRAMYETNTMAMAMFERLLDHQGEILASVRRLLNGKAFFLKAMEELGFRTLHNHGNFTHVAFGDKAPAIHAALADLVYYRQDFSQDCLKGFSRFSVAPEELIAPVIERIRSIA